jgi:similar to stage IV sporulation protein
MGVKMLILRLWNYLKGYVIIVVEGYFLEKFINICSHRKLRLWNVKWLKNSKITMKISIDDFRLLRPITRRTKCRVHIISKKGLPFILHKYKNRKAFVIGSAIFVIIFFLISSFVWDVSVTGNEQVSTEAIVEKLNDNGIKQGALKYTLDLDEIVESMMLEISDLARISISLRGTRIFVEVSERRKPPDLIDKKVPCDIVALKDGVITSIVAKEGLETVKVGETVTKGQLLITGIIENSKIQDAPPLLVHSMGTVKARTWYEASSPVEQTVVKKQRTGLQKDRYSIVLFTKKYKLFHREIPYNNSEHIEIRKKLTIGKNFVLPIEWLVDQYFEYELRQCNIDVAQAEKNASESALKLAQQQVPKNATIVKNDVYIIKAESGPSKAVATVECVENIGVTQKIGGI